MYCLSEHTQVFSVLSTTPQRPVCLQSLRASLVTPRDLHAAHPKSIFPIEHFEISCASLRFFSSLSWEENSNFFLRSCFSLTQAEQKKEYA